MKKEEKQLFRQLCSFQEESFDNDLLRYASPEILGHLFFNRMQGIAYGVLEKHECLGKVNREFRNSLKSSYEQNIEKNNSFMKCIDLLSEILQENSDRYAMLKGAYMCGVYPSGYRTANDIDLLVLPENVTDIGNSLLRAGFKQGYIRDEKFVPASRREIIESKMLRGETVPYILTVELPQMHFLEVDINFSLDYKNSDSAVIKAMLEQVTKVKDRRVKVSTLNQFDFFIHLCCHLYKEATTLPWVKMKRDMTLYKYADIYMMLDKINEKSIVELFDRARELELEKICAFAVLQTIELFMNNNSTAKREAKEILSNDADFLHRVIAPSEKKIYVYKTKNIAERLFMDDRVSDLEEVKRE